MCACYERLESFIVSRVCLEFKILWEKYTYFLIYFFIFFNFRGKTKRIFSVETLLKKFCFQRIEVSFRLIKLLWLLIFQFLVDDFSRLFFYFYLLSKILGNQILRRTILKISQKLESQLIKLCDKYLKMLKNEKPKQNI